MDINLSAKTLFHFTTKKDVLLNILKHGLYPRYSLENYTPLIKGESEIAIPMVSFCDIPLSQIKRHTDTYGKYCIGLSKEWGMKNKINPVIYAYTESITAQILNQLSQNLADFFDISSDAIGKNKKRMRSLKEMLQDPDFKYRSQLGPKISELQLKLGYFVRYIKPYEGPFYRDNAYLDKPVRFYDEREWRFTIPKNFFYDKPKIKDSYEKEYYINPVKRRRINMNLSKHISLNFEPKDIRFIVVEKESEIPDLLEKIEKIFEDRTSYKQLKLLGTRLISLEQILDDL